MLMSLVCFKNNDFFLLKNRFDFFSGLPVVLKAIQERWNLCKGLEPHWKPSVMLVDLVEKYGNPDIHLWVQLSKQTSKSKI